MKIQIIALFTCQLFVSLFAHGSGDPVPGLILQTKEKLGLSQVQEITCSARQHVCVEGLKKILTIEEQYPDLILSKLVFYAKNERGFYDEHEPGEPAVGGVLYVSLSRSVGELVNEFSKASHLDYRLAAFWRDEIREHTGLRVAVPTTISLRQELQGLATMRSLEVSAEARSFFRRTGLELHAAYIDDMYYALGGRILPISYSDSAEGMSRHINAFPGKDGQYRKLQSQVAEKGFGRAFCPTEGVYKDFLSECLRDLETLNQVKLPAHVELRAHSTHLLDYDNDSQPGYRKYEYKILFIRNGASAEEVAEYILNNP